MADTEKARRALTSESRISLSKEQASCDLAGEMAIVNFDNGVYYGLDPTGARIWKLLNQPLTFADLCSSLAHVYDVDQSTLESDVRAFIRELAEHGLVEIT
ncbi:MAG: PqqD family protein [Vicinamibacterales bacterium]